MPPSVISFALENKSPNGRLVLFAGKFTGVQVKACQSPHWLLEKLRSLQVPGGLRVLMALSLAMGLPGCGEEVESSTYPIGQTGETCTAYKGFDRQPPEVVVAELGPSRSSIGRSLAVQTQRHCERQPTMALQR